MRLFVRPSEEFKTLSHGVDGLGWTPLPKPQFRQLLQVSMGELGLLSIDEHGGFA